MIYARAMNLKKSRDVDTDNLIAHELSPYPTSMFENGHIKEAKGKAKLKNALQVCQTIKRIQVDSVFIGGCAFF